MNSLEWLKNKKSLDEEEKISPHLPVSPRNSIKLLKNNTFYSEEEINIYPFKKRLHPLGEIGEVTGDALEYKKSDIASNDSTNKDQITASPVSSLQGTCHVCWHRHIRAIPIKEGEPCFNCGSVN